MIEKSIYSVTVECIHTYTICISFTLNVLLGESCGRNVSNTMSSSFTVTAWSSCISSCTSALVLRSEMCVLRVCT